MILLLTTVSILPKLANITVYLRNTSEIGQNYKALDLILANTVSLQVNKRMQLIYYSMEHIETTVENAVLYERLPHAAGNAIKQWHR